MHHRTFFQGSEQPPTFPQEQLRKVIEEKGYQERIKILDVGERWISAE
jgi:hypothetical protein